MLEYANDHDDPRIHHLSIRHAMLYFVRIVENDEYLDAFNFDRDAGHLRRPTLSEAWRLLSCAWSTFCSLEELLESIGRNYYAYEVDEVVAATLDLHRAIEQEDWSRLGYE